MSSAQRRYLVEQGVGAAIFNFALNGVIAWLIFRGQAAIPLWGQQSIAGDTIGTCFFLPFLTCLIVTRVARGHVRAGRVTRLGWTTASHPALGWLPAGTVARAATLAVICMAIPALIVAGALGAAGVAEMRLWPFVLFKALFAALLAAAVTPVIVLWAIARNE